MSLYRTIAAVALGLIVVILLVYFVALRSNDRDVVVSRAEATRANQGADLSVTAGDIYANGVKSEAAIDVATRDNAETIHAAEGAKTVVPRAVNDAGLRALCVRRAYAGDPRCAALRPVRP